MKKPSNNKVRPITGWFLICRCDDDGVSLTDWYIAWENPFSTKKSALAFASQNNWPRPYKAVRGQITVQP